MIYLLSIPGDRNRDIVWYIYENYQKDMFITAMAIVHDQLLAEDIVQESFERIVKKVHLLEKISCNGLRQYTVLIVKSIAINMIEKQSKQKQQSFADDIETGDEEFTLEDTVIQRIQVSTIRECLNQMDIKYAHPLILRYYYGFSDRETAELLGLNSAGTVRSLCFRGRKMIIEALKKAGNNDE